MTAENVDALKLILWEYVREYPAFRGKPVGAPNSEKRREQERLIALEDRAKKLLASLEIKNRTAPISSAHLHFIDEKRNRGRY